MWLVCGVATIIAAVLAGRSRQARYLGRAAVGVLFIAGGALLHVISLATGGDYAGVADPAHFAWVTHAWNAGPDRREVRRWCEPSACSASMRRTRSRRPIATWSNARV